MVMVGSQVRPRRLAVAALVVLLLACAAAARADGLLPEPARAHLALLPEASALSEGVLSLMAPAVGNGSLVLPQRSGIPLGLASAAGLRRQPVPTPTAPPVLTRRMRKNTVSIGAQGQYGLAAGSSEIANGFDHGAGYAVRVRYMLSTRTALGFSFENQRFGSIRDPVPVAEVGDPPDSHLVNVTVAIEGMLFFHRERETNPYLLGGFGYATPDEIDTTLRGFAEIGNSELTTVVELAFGIHLYPGD